MAANGGQPQPSHYACKCLNIQIHSQPKPGEDSPPPAETGFKPVYVGEEGISVTHPEVTLRSRSRAIPVTGSPTAELSRYTSVTCLVCGLLTYRVAQQVTPDLSSEEGPVLPTDDWVEKELCKSATGWIEVFQGSLVDNDIAQAEASPMYSTLFQIVLPGGAPPSTASQTSEDEVSEVQNTRGPSEQGKKHLPEMPALFLPPPFTPSNIVFRHFSTVATEVSQKLRDGAEEYIAQVTERKVTELLTAEAALKREVDLIWNRFRENLVLQEHAGKTPAGVNSVRRRTSVNGHVRAVSNPTPGASASVRISHFIPTPTQSNRSSPNRTAVAHSALSASLKTSGMHYPGAAHDVNGNGNGNAPLAPLAPLAEGSPPSPGGSSTTRVRTPSIASSHTIALVVDAETSIREAHRREMDESKDMATSFRYSLDLEAQMEQQRLETLAEEQAASQPTASASSPTPPLGAATAAAAGHSPRVHRSAIKHATTDQATSPKGKAKDSAEDPKEGKGKRKVTFDVKPEVAIISTDEGEISSEQLTPQDTTEDAIFDMDNESEHSASSRAELPAAEQPKTPPPPHANTGRVRSSPRVPHGRSLNNSGLPPQLQSLRPASLPVPSSIRPPPARHTAPPSTETAERSKALRESLVNERPRPEVVETPVDIISEEALPEGPHDPREEEILKLVAASTPSHRSAWKKNSKAWQVFLSRRERKAEEAGPEAIMEESNYVLDDFNPQPGHRFNRIADSDTTDDDGEDAQWLNGNDEHAIAQSLPIPIGLNQRMQGFGVSAFQPKTSLSDRPGLLVPALHQTSSSLRRASYAERDRLRPVDPGALDFAGDDEYDDDVDSDPEIGGKARQRALKILKARNEMPPAGMWRSLA